MAKRSEPVPKAYRPWLIISVVVLVGSLVLLAVAVAAAFVSFGDRTTPFWVIVVGALAVMGVAVGFGGFFLIMAAAAYQNWRESRRVQVIPPEHSNS